MKNEKTYNLVFTEIRKTLSNNINNLLLGHWCLEQNEEYLKEFRYEISEFEKKEKDNEVQYKNNLQIYEKLLDDIIINLKDVYDENWSRKSWEIFIGSWISRYIFIIKNRYHALKYAFENYNIKQVSISDYKNFSFVTEDTVDFKLKTNNDIWNFNLFSMLWCEYIDPDKKVKTIVIKNESKNIEFGKNNFKKFSSFKFLKYKIFKFFENILCKKNRIIFYRSNFGNKFLLIKTLLKLKNFPFYYNFDSKLNNVTKLNLKRKDKFISSSDEKIHKILNDNFYDFLPTYFLESLDELKFKFRELLLPKTPKIVFSANPFVQDNLFKFWLAKNIMNKGKIITFQHGNNYGTTKICPQEDIEVKLSDKFLTWGWSDKSRPNIEAFGIFKNIEKKINLVNKRKILLIISSTYNYVTGEGTGEILSMRTKKYQKILDELIKKMPNFILENIFIRGNYVGEKLRSSKITSNIKKKYKNLKFQNSKKPLINVFNDFGLILNSNDSTVFLESMALNKPTISLMDETLYFNHFRSEPLEIFAQLKEVGIIHTNIDSLIDFLKKINFNFNEWWNTERVNKIKYLFVKNYCKPIDNFPEEINIFTKNL